MTVYEKYIQHIPGWSYPIAITIAYVRLLFNPQNSMPITAEELLDVVMDKVGRDLRARGEECEWGRWV
jgi:hypothetical protein